VKISNLEVTHAEARAMKALAKCILAVATALRGAN